MDLLQKKKLWLSVSIAVFEAKAISEIGILRLVWIFFVYNTSVDKLYVKHVAKVDVTCASASKMLRADIDNKAALQLGATIPAYTLTKKGKSVF